MRTMVLEYSLPHLPQKYIGKYYVYIYIYLEVWEIIVILHGAYGERNGQDAINCPQTELEMRITHLVACTTSKDLSLLFSEDSAKKKLINKTRMVNVWL